MKPILSIVILMWFFTSCEIKPKPINYGSDNCQYCNMTIVDKQHAAQIVTDKGRVYKFDAIECLLNYTRENTARPVSIYLVNDFKNPGELIDATNATYLISPEISSPMGANLSGFHSKLEARETQANHDGTLYDWEQLVTHFKKEEKRDH
ncbi:nitrous oxide reductase accessory protein NosL [Sinomicrobium kalidii]|uniref:nitrous oxide reductase accessory protein NosL n=1 Tax=Sinomicrobium kalidii TaxID=2900738 RepID=UPI001E641A82|nr:nitrous oxide reductase accessory protein NosL [Sinomicrobium kalidii]UGU14628.1 nitrous oxide reductase accessory protein NosL [Sinomicrobium kalidii]